MWMLYLMENFLTVAPCDFALKPQLYVHFGLVTLLRTDKCKVTIAIWTANETPFCGFKSEPHQRTQKIQSGGERAQEARTPAKWPQPTPSPHATPLSISRFFTKSKKNWTFELRFSTGSQTGCALKRHWIFRMAIYIQYGLCCPSPAPWVQSDVPSEVAKRLCDTAKCLRSPRERPITARDNQASLRRVWDHKKL